MLQHLAHLNEDVALLQSCSYNVEVGFSYPDFYTIVYLIAFFSEAKYFGSIPTIKCYHT